MEPLPALVIRLLPRLAPLLKKFRNRVSVHFWASIYVGVWEQTGPENYIPAEPYTLAIF